MNHFIWVTGLASVLSSSMARDADVRVRDVLIPAGLQVREDTYLCRLLPLDEGFLHAAEARLSLLNHHAMVTTCTPGLVDALPGEVWDCSEGPGDRVPGLRRGSMCQDDDWDFYLPESIRLPSGSAFALMDNREDDKNIQLVLAVHYAHLDEHRDRSPITDGTEGMILHFLPPTSVRQAVGVMVVEARTDGSRVLPAKQTSVVEFGCQMPAGTGIGIIDIGFHTHSLATRASAWKSSLNNSWTLIDDRQGNQAVNHFDPRPDGRHIVLLESGDWIFVRCTYNNTRDTESRIGLGLTDEMCQVLVVYDILEPRVGKLRGCSVPSGDSTFSRVPPIISDLLHQGE